MRFGLVGNGYWARVTHAAGLQLEPSVEFAGLWGRDPAKTASVAAELGVIGYEDVEAMFADVDAVAFSVPPQVQAVLARRAAELGLHVLLEKPIATSAEAATDLADTIAEHNVASVVFFTSRYDAAQSCWIDQVAGQDWDAAAGLWLGSAFAAGSPFDTPWRHDLGGLWDVGPHALSLVSGVLGEIVNVTARAGRRDLVHLVIEHASGATSSYALSIDSDPAAAQNSLTVWGAAGVAQLPDGAADDAPALATAARQLVAAAALDTPEHPLDARFGASVVRWLEQAQRQLG